MKNNKNILLSISILFFSITTFSQANSFDDWVKGRVYLNNGDTLSGYVIYEESQNIVQFSDEERSKVKTFSSFVLSGFEQSYKDYTRYFTRFYWNKGYENVQKVPDFFEVIYDSKIKLLSKDKKSAVLDNWPSSNYGMDPYSAMRAPMYIEVVVRSFYVQLENGSIVPIYKPKRDFIKLFPDKKNKLKEYFKHNYVPPDDTEKILEVIKLVE